MRSHAAAGSSLVAPSTAERIRSACARGGAAMLAVEGLEPSPTPVHHLFDDGSFAITVPANGLLNGLIVGSGAGGIQAVLEMTDYAPLPLREPVRSLVWLSGRLFAVPASDVSPLLDLIAAKSPNPALLQVNTGASRRGGRRHPLRPGAARDRLRRRGRLDGRGVRRRRRPARRQPRPVLHAGVVLAAAPRVRPPRRRRPIGRPAARAAAPRPRPPARPRPLRRATARREPRTATTTSGCRSPSPSTTSPA